jgi:hypothetical protein
MREWCYEGTMDERYRWLQIDGSRFTMGIDDYFGANVFGARPLSQSA